MTNDLGMFTVSGEWMKACGYGAEPRTFDVLRVMEFPGRGEGFERFFKVEMDDGRVWVVAELRGTYLPFVNDLTVPGGCGAARNPFALKFKRFFSIDDAKAAKAQKVTRNWLNAINYMAPADTAGVGDLCPWRTVGCTALCLGTESGQAAMRKAGEDNGVTLSRKRKARFYMGERVAFMREAAWHVARALVRARKEARRLCVRMNGATDVAWESATVDVDAAFAAALSKLLGRPVAIGKVRLMSLFPEVQFIDYTKGARRALRALTDPSWPTNYRLTFSRSEANDLECFAILKARGTVAVVSSMPRPKLWHGFPTIDGDRHDLRHLDRPGRVVWLTPKGNKAKRDASGFVLREAA